METKTCPQCGAPVNVNETECKYCGAALPLTINPQAAPTFQQPVSTTNPQAAPIFQQPVSATIQQSQSSSQQLISDGIDPAWPIKSKTAAGVLAILLGGLGIHKFYLGKVGTGIIYLLFCWTYIPAVIGFIEGIVYLTSNDHNFQVKNHVRIN